MVKWIIGEIITLLITIDCFRATYAIYWGDAMVGQFGGLIFVFFGWIPAVISFLLIPLNGYLIYKIYQTHKRQNDEDALL